MDAGDLGVSGGAISLGAGIGGAVWPTWIAIAASTRRSVSELCVAAAVSSRPLRDLSHVEMAWICCSTSPAG